MPDRARLPDWPRAMSADLASQYVSMSKSAFESSLRAGVLPKPIKISVRRKAWLREDLDAYLDALAGKKGAGVSSGWDD